jgi:hypothetical protein
MYPYISLLAFVKPCINLRFIYMTASWGIYDALILFYFSWLYFISHIQDGYSKHAIGLQRVNQNVRSGSFFWAKILRVQADAAMHARTLLL